jgi:hypothetical protein
MTRLDLSELPRLRELRIESAGGSGLARVSVAYCGRLETLELRGLEVELDLLLVDCAALRSVTVGGSKALGAAHTALKTCPTLARLTVRPSWAPLYSDSHHSPGTRHDTQLLSSACSIRALLALVQRWCPELQYLQFNAVAVSRPFDPAAHHVNEGQGLD